MSHSMRVVNTGQLYDETEKLIVTGKSSHDNFSINVEKLPAGIYILKLYNGYELNVATEKVVIK